MKLRPFITHTLILAIGIAIGGAVVGYTFIFKELPNAKSYIGQEARYIQLKDGEEPVSYEHILNEYFLGKLYFWNPLYKFKQSEGKKILTNLANRNYTPAAWDLHTYYMMRSFDPLKHLKGQLIITNQEYYDEAYHWARVAAEQGYLADLLGMIYFYKLDEHKKNIQEDLDLLEKLIPNSSVPDYSRELGKIYAKLNQPEKAKYWLDNAKKVQAAPYKEPACMTIKPWRGH